MQVRISFSVLLLSALILLAPPGVRGRRQRVK